MTAPMSRSRRAAFGATLTLTMAGPPLIVIALSALGPLVVADLDLTRAEFGSFATVAFAVAALFSAAGGRLVDRVGGRPAAMVVCGGACVALLLVAAAPTYGLVLAAVALSGFLLALANPATNLLVSTHAPPRQRGALVGLKQSGVQVSQILGGALLPGLAVLAGWRVAATVAAGLLAPTVLMSYFFLPATSLRGDDRPARARRRVPAEVWWMTGYSFLLGCALQATIVYLPLFAHEDLGLSVSVAGLSAAVMGAVGLVARVAWGRLFERVRRPQLLLVLLAVVAMVAVGVLRTAGVSDAPWLVWIAVVMHGASAVAANAVVMLAVVTTSDPAFVGAATGLVATGQFAGFALGPIAFGALVDGAGVYGLGWLAVGVVYLLAAVVMAVAAWGVGHRRDRTARRSSPRNRRPPPGSSVSVDV